MIKKTILVLSALSIISCSNETKNNNFIELNINETPRQIKGEQLKFNELLNPSKMLFHSPYLFLTDSKAPKRIHLVDYKTNEYINNIATAGKGPGELLSASSLDIHKNALWVHDMTLNKYVSYNLDSLKSKTYNYSDEIFFKNKATQNFSPKWLAKNEEKIVSTTFSDSKYRLMITDDTGEVIEEKFEMFASPSKNIPNTVHNMSYQSILKIKPDDSKVVIVNRYADLLEIYDMNTDEIKRIKTHSNYEPVYKVMTIDGGSTMGQGDDMRFGYIDLSVSDDKIYTLFSGRTRAEGKANYGDIICVYDWNGNFITSYKLESRAIGLQLIKGNEFITIEKNENGQKILKKYIINE